MKDTHANALCCAHVSQGQWCCHQCESDLAGGVRGERLPWGQPHITLQTLGELVGWLVKRAALSRVHEFFVSESHLTLGGQGRQWPDPGWGRAGLLSQSLDWSITRYLHCLLLWSILLETSFSLGLMALCFLKCEWDLIWSCTLPSLGRIKVDLNASLSYKCSICALPRILKDRDVVRSWGKLRSVLSVREKRTVFGA